jgi:arylsulfatase A-like enzyme
MAGVEIPEDREIDGVDLSQTLLENAPSPRDHMFFYRGPELFAVRLNQYKAHFITQGEYGQFGEKEVHETPILYNLSEDPSEAFDIAENHPEVLEKINTLVEQHREKMVPGKDQLAEREPAM